MPEQLLRIRRQVNEFDRALYVATHFGFMPITAPKVTKKDIELVRSCGNDPYYNAVEKVALIRTYIEEDLASMPHPIAVVYKRPDFKKSAGGHALHFIGSPSGIAEASLIRAAFSILSEEGHKNLIVEINCIGDKESVSTYERELTNFIRKSNSEMSEEFKQSLKEDIFNLFRIEDPELIRLREIAPSSITFLSTQSRTYFKEVLEYIEALGIEFRLVPTLIGEKNHVSHTVFMIKDSENTNILAVGYRYSRLGRFLGLRKEVPMAGVTIFPKLEKDEHGRIYKDLPKPKFYMVQLGQEAKIKTLTLIELLRSHRIPVYHYLGTDKISAQLLNAENLRVPYLIIIGQKEALSNTATIRNMSTRAQDTIDINVLPQYLKHIHL